MGLVLGAVVSTTDAIAATSIAKRLCMPKRITDVLEGESLVNDATGLLALEIADHPARHRAYTLTRRRRLAGCCISSSAASRSAC